MTGHRGPQSIPLPLAEKLIQALNPILDLLAEVPSKPKKFAFAPKERKIEENRWALWRAVMIAHEAVCYQSDTKIWRESPIRQRAAHEGKFGNWWDLRCGRPTKKGEPCKARLAKGRAWCFRHSTPQENKELRLWQDRIHLPYPRAGEASSFDIDGMLDALREIRELTSS